MEHKTIATVISYNNISSYKLTPAPFKISRTFEIYAQYFNASSRNIPYKTFSQLLKQGQPKLWIDSGCGAGEAFRTATHYISTQTKFLGLTSQLYPELRQNLELLPDRFSVRLGNVPDTLDQQLETADVLTDVYGPYFYATETSLDLFESKYNLLKAYYTALSISGKAFIFLQESLHSKTSLHPFEKQLHRHFPKQFEYLGQYSQFLVIHKTEKNFPEKKELLKLFLKF